MRIGIFFGGNSREREVSFAGGRTVYDNLDKSIFDAIPIFVDSFNNFILLDWKYIYKGSIRDFYPPVDYIKKSKSNIQIYAESIEDAYSDNGKAIASSLGKIISVNELHDYIDFAFLALHGAFGEDGTIQGLLEWQGIPYSGSGILPSAIGMHKSSQKSWMKHAQFNSPEFTSISKHDWQTKDQRKIFSSIKLNLKFPFVVKPANQGSSVGVTVVSKNNFEVFEDAMNKAFFISKLFKNDWLKLSKQDKLIFIQKLSDIRDGIGLPCLVGGKVIYHPDALIELINRHFKKNDSILLEGVYSETEVLLESFIEGREFSCIVLRKEDGGSVALPPTEIVKGKEVYDYRSKYLPGLSRKITPIDLPEKEVQLIRKECERLFDFFKFNVYARIDGFINSKGQLFLNDPNTTSGMMPSSFFFHQAAEIGLNPSQFLTFIIRTSIAERISTWPVHFQLYELLNRIDEKISKKQSKKSGKRNVAVFMGGYSTERHISVESGRNIYEKLSSSKKFNPFPVFVSGNEDEHELYLLPINIMLKDNADDIKEKVMHFKRAAVVDKIIVECKSIIQKYGSPNNLFTPRKITYTELAKMTDAVFIALHGRPGEDGQVQSELNKFKIPFNGSDVDSSRITINKFDTNELLRNHGFLVADHLLIHENDWKRNVNDLIKKVEKIGYPLIAKPADDGCSSAVKKIKNKQELLNYAEGAFRSTITISPELALKLDLKPKEEFPKKKYFLIEKFVDKGKAVHFLEITGGLITHYDKGKIKYELFEPSETLAEGEILSLEEKFLAGQGQNITPARFSLDKKLQKIISEKVKMQLKDAAKILKIEGYCRIDAFVRIYKNNEVDVIFIEVNSLPGMTPATCIFHQCAINNYKPFEFIDQILEFGEERVKLAK
jgi:D-alanine-D-alanine ligase